MKPLANWPAAWATAPCKKSASLSWLLRKNLPRIVVVFLRACFQLVLNFRHQEGYQPPYQPRGPKHPKNNFSFMTSILVIRQISPRIFVLFPQACFQIVQLVSQFRHRRNGWRQHEQHWQPIRAKKFLQINFKVVGWTIKSLTQNRRCLSSGIFSDCSIELSAGDSVSSPSKWWANAPAPAANKPFNQSYL